MKIKELIKSLKPKPTYDFKICLKSGQSVVVSYVVGVELIESLFNSSTTKVNFKSDGEYSHFFNLEDIECVIRCEVEQSFGG